jgi:hypothetical protein
MSITVELTNGQRITVAHDTATIGQDPASDICIPDSPQIQTAHARIVKVAHKWMIQSSGDWLLQVGNGVPGRKLWLKAGDVISLSESGPHIIFQPKPVLSKPVVNPAEPASASIPSQMPLAQPLPSAPVPPAQPASVPLAQPVPPAVQATAADSTQHPLPPFLQPIQRTPAEKPKKSQPAKESDEEDDVWEDVFGYWMDEKQK